MATSPKTVRTYDLNGSAKDFAIPFEYLARKFVVVTLIGVDRKVLVLNTDYRFTSPTQITTTVAWGTGSGYDMIEIRRMTSATDRLVDFSDGSLLKAYDLNTSQIQSLHIAEEARDLTADTIAVNNDGNLDARGRRIVNLANAIDPTDAISYGQVMAMSDGAYQSMQQAVSAANAAIAAQNSAESYKNSAQSSAGTASTAESNALSYKNAANASAVDADASEEQARIYKNAAETAAWNAGVSEGNARGLVARFLPPAASNPATRADGSPLVVGDRYLNTTSGYEYIFQSSGWVINNVNGSNLADSSSTAMGAALVGYKPPGTGSVGMTLYAKVAESLSVADFGVQPGTGVDLSASIQIAIDASVALKKPLYFPPGKYVAKNLQARANMSLIADGPVLTEIGLASGATTGLIVSPSNRIDDVSIEGFTFWGNSAGNPTFNVSIPLVRIVGCRKSIVNNVFTDSPGGSLETDFDSSQAERNRSFLDYIVHNLIENGQGHGWEHKGGSDLYCAQMEVVDVGLKTHNTYYGIWLRSGSGNGCFFNIHTWNRSYRSVTTAAMCRVDSSGSTFTGSHFEGGVSALSVAGSGNTFAACAFYAPRGTHAVVVASTGVGNTFHGTIGLVTFGTNYAGFYLSGPGNIIDVCNVGAGCVNGTVDFSADPGFNSVRVRGYQASGPSWTGTPNNTTAVDILLTGGATLGHLLQAANDVWAVWTPTVTAGNSAAFGSGLTAVGRYRKMGKTVNFNVTITIPLIGSAGTSVIFTNPVAANTSLGGQSSVCGREAAVTGKALQGVVNANSTQIFNYDNTFPAVNGSTIRFGGMYEAA